MILIYKQCCECGKNINIKCKTNFCLVCLRLNGGPFKGRKHTTEAKKRCGGGSVDYSGKSNPMYGKKHSKKSKIKMSENSMGCVSPRKGVKLSQKTKSKISKNHADVCGVNNPMYGKSIYDVWREKHTKEEVDIKITTHKNRLSKALSGKNNPHYGISPSFYTCEYNGVRLKSSYELKRAKFLDSINTKWKYEEITYELGDFTYTPDFFIYDDDNNLIRIEEVKSEYTYSLRKEKIDMFIEVYKEESKYYHILFEQDLEKVF
jgi:hypothetical protein